MDQKKDAQTDEDEFGQDRAAFLPKWDFEASPVFTGTIVSRETIEGLTSPLTGDEHDVDLYTVADDNGEAATVWGSGMLARSLPNHIGHRVRITNVGLTQQPGGTQLRVFEVKCATCTKAGK